MRKILFRGFCLCEDKREKILIKGKWKKGKWVYGCLFLVDKKPYIIENTGFQRKVFPETVGQFTGLYDKNDIAVFEGDIVQIKNYDFEFVGKVIYDDNIASFIVGNDEDAEPFYLESEEFEVIESIHDNPELSEV